MQDYKRPIPFLSGNNSEGPAQLWSSLWDWLKASLATITAQLLSLPSLPSLTPLQMLCSRVLLSKHPVGRSPVRVLFQGSWPVTTIVMTILSIGQRICSPCKTACLAGPLVEFPNDGPYWDLTSQPYAHLVQDELILFLRIFPVVWNSAEHPEAANKC